MNTKQIAEIAKNHWRTEYPEGYQTLVRENRLEREADAAAKLTLAEMRAQMQVGVSEQQAWQASQGLFVMTDPLTS